MKHLKSFCLALSIVAVFGSCGGSDNKSTKTDTTGDKTLPPPADNSSATNPSLADTAYPSKDTMKTHGDSVRSKK